MSIVLYASDHCSSCKEAVRFFQVERIPYRHLNVVYNSKNFKDMLRHGDIAKSFIHIGNVFIKENKRRSKRG